MLRYAIMGTNWLSHIYYHAIEAAGDQVIAVCSRSPERAEELGQGKTLVYTNLDEMLKIRTSTSSTSAFQTSCTQMRRFAACGRESMCCVKSLRPSALRKWSRSSARPRRRSASLQRPS